MVASKSIATDKNGNVYLILEIQDGDTKVTARYFGRQDVAEKEIELHQVIEAMLQAQVYNGHTTYLLKAPKVIEGADIAPFIRSAPEEVNAMFDECIKYANTIQNEDIKTVVLALLNDNKDKMLYWSAAKNVHHDFYGGLLYHTVRMVRHAHMLSKVYNFNRDLVIAGCLLHDLGKIKELVTDAIGIAEYSVEGDLFGHLFLGTEMVRAKCDELNIDEVVKRELSHIIASHHCNKEWGAISTPASKEAYIVSQIDDMDAKFIIYESTESEIEAGTTSEETPFGLNSKVYKSEL